MSFIENLANKQRRGAELRPETQTVPISLPEAMSGLAGSFRDPNRVSKPMGSPFSSGVKNEPNRAFYDIFRN